MTDRVGPEGDTVDVTPSEDGSTDRALRSTTAPTTLSALSDGFEGTSTTLSPDGGADPDRRAGGGFELPERYLDLGPIGRGGMGDVRRVRDRRLDQVLAMKLIRWTLMDSARARQRFIREARVTARLQHPGIVSVHDVGELPDGRLWFTMREVRGRTLARVIRAVHRVSRPDAWGWTDDGWHIQRLLGAFEQACQAVAFAHSEGVVHRDLKPDNIMVGAFGEVLVMDWGIARMAADLMQPTLVAGSREAALAADDDDPVFDLGLSAAATRVGAVLGSPAYMAPEQALGEVHRHGPSTDVWALGAILSAILTGRAPGRDPAEGEPPPPAPPELEALVRWSMADDPGERPADAGRFAGELRAWLDGTRRRTMDDVRREARAEALVAEADRRMPEVERLRAAAASLRARADRILQPLPPDAPADQKRPGWRLEDDAELLERQAEQKAMGAEQALMSALAMLDLPAAHARLAARGRALLEDAERRGDDRGAVRAEALLRAHGAPADLEWLDGPGALTLLTDPPGVRVTARPLVPRDRRLVEGGPIDLGPTPLVDAPLERGRWMLHLEHPERASARYPVRIDRGTRWHGIPPGGEAALPVRLLRPDALEPDDRYVPAGWFHAGGDPEALDGRRLWIDAFVIKRDPVTVGAYRAFLDALVAAGRAADAERHQPVERSGGSAAGRPVFTRLDDGRYGEAIDGNGARWSDDCPMPLVDLAGARAYAAWWAAETGRPWRLPGDLMWEKAARGADGRRFPWGDFFEPTWACAAVGQGGRPAPVGAHPIDESPYGVRGLAGGVREWCDTPDRRAAPPDRSRADAPVECGGPRVMLRGGSWPGTPAAFRLARPLVDAD